MSTVVRADPFELLIFLSATNVLWLSGTKYCFFGGDDSADDCEDVVSSAVGCNAACTGVYSRDGAGYYAVKVYGSEYAGTARGTVEGGYAGCADVCDA